MKRRTLISRLLGAGAALLLAIPMSACAGEAAPEGFDSTEINFASATASTQDLFDPTRQLSNVEIIMVGQIYDSLLKLGEGFQPHPGVIESWEADAEGKIWTLSLRDGVTFHDGSPVTTEDIKYSIARNLDPTTSSPVVGLLGQYLTPDDIRVVDDHTVELSLSSPYSFLPKILGNRYMRVIPAGTTEFDEPIGTGPYRMVAHTPGQSVELERYDEYWGEKPSVEKVISRNIPDPSSRLQALLSSEVDAVESIEYSQVPTIEENDGLKITIGKGIYVHTVDLDLTQEPFNDPRVIEAIKLSIDRQQLVDTVFHGLGTVAADTPVSPSDPFFNEATLRERDIERAKQLLAEAGYPDGFTHEFIVSDVGPSMVQFGVALSEQLAEVGIDFKIQEVPSSTYWDNYWLKASASTVQYVNRTVDEMLTYIGTTDGGFNGTGWSNSEFDALVKQARLTLDEDEQRDIYARAQELMSKEGGNLIPVYVDLAAAGKQGLDDFGYDPVNFLTFNAKASE